MMPEKTKGILMPNNKESNNRFKALMHRLFARREILIRRNADIKCFDVPAWLQAGAAGVALSFGVWTLIATGCFFKNELRLAAKNDRIAVLSDAYRNLLSEVKALNDHVGVLSSELAENDADAERLRLTAETAVPTVRKVDAFSDENKESEHAEETKAVHHKRDVLRAQTEVVRARLAALLSDGKISGGDAHEALLQRDLAMADAALLQDKVRDLERQVAAMQDTQILAFRKMAAVADKNIGAIESGLADIDGSLQAAGLGVNSLLRRVRRDKEKTGVGGPFIPAPMPQKGNRVNISLVSLNQRLDKLYDLTALQNALPIGKPISRIRVTSPFGAREDPFQGVPARHEAVDLGGMTGEPIHATAPGKVLRAGRWGWYGNMVEIDHGLGFRTRYAHMDKIFVSKGDAVRTGDQIGTVGSTGRSSGSHLHYEIRVRGYAVDPMSFMKAERNVFKD